MNIAYICVYPDGCPVQIDYHSGGYPARAEFCKQQLIYRATFFNNVEKAKDYAAHFWRNTYGGPLSIKKITFIIEDI